MSRELKLSTGKILEGHAGIIGLGVAPYFELGSGADDVLLNFEENRFDEYPKLDNPGFLTRQERLELCDIMIARWQAFKTKTEAL